MIFLDTSYLFALFNKIDDHHERAVALSKEIQNEDLYIPFLVFQELMSLITSKFSSREALHLMRALLAEDSPIRLMKIDEEYFDETIRTFAELEVHRFSFVDTFLIVLAKEFSARVVTFDRRLAQELDSSPLCP